MLKKPQSIQKSVLTCMMNVCPYALGWLLLFATKKNCTVSVLPRDQQVFVLWCICEKCREASGVLYLDPLQGKDIPDSKCLC